jgi:hypothetical protein
MDAGLMGNESERVRSLAIVQETTDLINRIAGLITEEQGAALMSSLIRDLKKRGPNG